MGSRETARMRGQAGRRGEFHGGQLGWGWPERQLPEGFKALEHPSCQGCA